MDTNEVRATESPLYTYSSRFCTCETKRKINNVQTRGATENCDRVINLAIAKSAPASQTRSLLAVMAPRTKKIKKKKCASKPPGNNNNPRLDTRRPADAAQHSIHYRRNSIERKHAPIPHPQSIFHRLGCSAQRTQIRAANTHSHYTLRAKTKCIFFLVIFVRPPQGELSVIANCDAK